MCSELLSESKLLIQRLVQSLGLGIIQRPSEAQHFVAVGYAVGWGTLYHLHVIEQLMQQLQVGNGIDVVDDAGAEVRNMDRS